MSHDPSTIIHRWFNEVWTQGREEVIDELFSPHAVGHGLGEGDTDVRGPAEFKTFWRNMRSALPDVSIRIEDTVSQGEMVVVRVVLEGTHLGDGLGIPRTGRRVCISGIVMGRIVNGQLYEGWNSWDQLGLLRQLGAIPAFGETDRFLSTQAG